LLPLLFKNGNKRSGKQDQTQILTQLTHDNDFYHLNAMSLLLAKQNGQGRNVN